MRCIKATVVGVSAMVQSLLSNNHKAEPCESEHILGRKATIFILNAEYHPNMMEMFMIDSCR